MAVRAVTAALLAGLWTIPGPAVKLRFEPASNVAPVVSKRVVNSQLPTSNSQRTLRRRTSLLGSWELGRWALTASKADNGLLEVHALLAAQAGWPEGSGAAIAKARCVSCHEADLIMSQRLSRAGWTREIDKMVRWGAPVTDAEREPLTMYLATYFVPAPMVSHPRAAEGETLYRNACLTCHEADLIVSQRLSRAGWTREIDKMIRWGAQVSAADKEPLADYLASGVRGTR